MLVLQDEDVAAIVRIQRLLLDLPERRSFGAIREIMDAMIALLGASRGFAGIWFDGQLNFLPVGVGPHIEKQIMDNFLRIDEQGNFIMRDKEYETVNMRRREAGSGIYPDWVIYDEHTKAASPWYNDVFVPAGMSQTIGMNSVLPVGEALMAFGFNGEDDPNYRSERTLHLFDLLHPAFDAAFMRLYAQSFDRPAVLRLLDMLPCPAALRANDGEVVHANGHSQGKSWDELVSEGAGSDRVFVISGPNLPDLRGTELLIDLSGSDVELGRLARDAGLTDRQAEVAEQIALGLSDKEIARELGISPNTARRHCEAVLDRLDVNSRSGVLFKLISGQGPRHRPAPSLAA